jgi:hypothetical protein
MDESVHTLLRSATANSHGLMQFGGFFSDVWICSARFSFEGKIHKKVVQDCFLVICRRGVQIKKWLAQEPSASEKYLLLSSIPGVRRGLVSEPGCGVA